MTTTLLDVAVVDSLLKGYQEETLHKSNSAFCHNILTETPAMKRTLNTTINRSKNDEHYTQLADIEEMEL